MIFKFLYIHDAVKIFVIEIGFSLDQFLDEIK